MLQTFILLRKLLQYQYLPRKHLSNNFANIQIVLQSYKNMHPNRVGTTTSLVFLRTFLLLFVLNIGSFVVSENEYGQEISNSIYPPFTEKEKVAIKKFREMMYSDLYQNYMKMDQYLIRWIKDSDFDLNAAKQKLLKAIEWRKKNKIDSILSEDFSSMLKTCPHEVKGHDKIGRPIVTFNLGICDLRKLVLAGDLTKFRRLTYYGLESAASAVRQIYKSGKDIRDGIIIADLNGFNLRQHACLRCIPVAFEMLDAYESYYPYYLHKVILVNLPRIALPFVDVFVPHLTPRSKEIYQIFGYDRNEWETEIRKLIEPEQLSYQYGGLKLKAKSL